MKSLRPVLSGLLAALISVFVILGSLVQALAEGTLRAEPALSDPAASAPAYVVTLLPGRTATIQGGTPTLIAGLTLTATFPHPTTCAVPAGWQDYIVQAGDTLAGLAQRYQTSVQTLIEGNCLITQKLVPGTILAVPPGLAPAPSSTQIPSAVPCGPPPGWVIYVVQRGDTLFKISQEVGASVAAIQFANCMGTSNLIRTNDRLSVPTLPARSPTQTPAPQATAAATTTTMAAHTLPPPTDAPTLPPSETPIPSETPTQVMPTATGTETPGMPTEAPTLPPADTATPDPAQPSETPADGS